MVRSMVCSLQTALGRWREAEDEQSNSSREQKRTKLLACISEILKRCQIVGLEPNKA
jgi:hypothetical protein